MPEHIEVVGVQQIMFGRDEAGNDLAAHVMVMKLEDGTFEIVDLTRRNRVVESITPHEGALKVVIASRGTKTEFMDYLRRSIERGDMKLGGSDGE